MHESVSGADSADEAAAMGTDHSHFVGDGADVEGRTQQLFRDESGFDRDGTSYGSGPRTVWDHV